MRLGTAVIAALLVGISIARVAGHGGTAPIWNREISRLVYEKCASCHRPDGTAFSLMTYLDAQPRANEIKDAVLTRRMPPWGAVKGFGTFRNDQSLSEEQIELFRRWVDGGIRRGNNPRALPATPSFAAPAASTVPPRTVRVVGAFTLAAPLVVDGVWPERVPENGSVRVTAQRPDGHIEPLVWLHHYNGRPPHPFLFRRPLSLPAGTVIRLPDETVIGLIPVSH